MNTSYLVNIVANDFKDGQSIFEPFLLDKPINGAASLVNGVKGAATSLLSGINGVVNGH